MAWLEANYRMVISDYHRAFVAAFGRDDVTVCNLNQLRKRKGWKVGRDGGRYVGRLQKFNDAEIAWLRNNCTLPIADYHAAFQAAFTRPDITPQKLHALRKRQGWKTGRTGQFTKGQEPINKGKPCPPGVGGRHPNAQRTQFRKGEIPHTFKGAGHQRIDSKDGYVVIIIEEANPWTGANTRPVHKHRWLWEQQNGPIPEGHALKCLDGDKTNCDPSNWELIPRALLPYLNGGRASKGVQFDHAQPEVKPVILTVAKLKHQAKQVKQRQVKAGA
jgi:hypothetical protein